MGMDSATIEVRLVGLLETVGGRPEIRCEVLPGTPLPRFMAELSEYLGPDFKKFVLDKSGAIYPGIMIIRDGAIIPPRFLASYRFEKNCVLKIMPIISGG